MTPNIFGMMLCAWWIYVIARRRGVPTNYAWWGIACLLGVGIAYLLIMRKHRQLKAAGKLIEPADIHTEAARNQSGSDQ